MSETSPRLGLPLLMPAQAQKHVTHNEALLALETLTQLVLEARDGLVPPPLPGLGEIHALGAAPQGAWDGQGGMLAAWDGTGWRFVAPQEGWRAWDKAAGRGCTWRSGAWADDLPETDHLDGVGIGTAHDATNRLAVAAQASLFSHVGGGHQLKINKAGSADTASLLYQSGWTGHAEMGLAGDTDFRIKVSADGSAWTEAAVFEAASGRMSGAAVQSAATDATAGRLMTVGAFGLGNPGLAPVLANLNDTAVPSGLYAFSGAATANWASRPAPYAAGDFGSIRIERYGPNHVTQTIRRAAGDPMPFFRRGIDGTWEGWQRIYVASNILGPVSQLAGLPTGAVLERGANANGEYLRMADGTQIAHGTRVLDFALAGTFVFPLPASFAALAAGGVTGVCSGSGTAVANFASVRASGASSTTNFFVNLLGTGGTGSGGEYQLTFLFVGRWY